DMEENRGKLGVFWHTQGSGKSYSMLFFSQKVLRKLPGNWTFLLVTDRQELDTQIYKTFAATGAVVEKENQVHAYSGTHLQRLLREDHRYVFTLIHKFHTGKGEVYPALSDRADIIVITDEAHRSQYDTLALNMRNALPNAAFLAFTGTPLIATEERTREVFGDYVSIYNFKQSIDDGSTVPLYYENRIPELQITNAELNADMEALIEEAELDDAQQEKLEREFARQYHLITREDRLDTIAEDIVQHFMGRGYLGKAMVVCIDKATAVKMHDQVRKHWLRYRADLEKRLKSAVGEEPGSLQERIGYMRETDMAVVVSQSQNEVEDLKEKGLDITPHRKRMLSEDLETKFKDPADPFRIVFVCAMWMTGFDAPSVSTIYLDKPMRNHTLMQTIARANRVHGDKLNGLIVDYLGVFRDLQKALAIYGAPRDGQAGDGGVDTPVKDKNRLVEQLRAALAEMEAFFKERDIDPQTIAGVYGFEKVKLLDAMERVLRNDQTRAQYMRLYTAIGRLYKAILPDAAANEFARMVALYTIITSKIRTDQDPPDISKILEDVEALLDLSIEPKSYIIRERGLAEDGNGRIDLGKIDVAKLRAQFEAGQRYAAIQQLRSAISQSLEQLVRLNKTRTDYLQRFQQLIDDYNSGAEPIDLTFARFQAFHDQLDAEARRNITEGLSEEELALYDLLTTPGVNLSPKEKESVKQAAHNLLETLKKEKLVLDWRKRQQSRAQVLTTIELVLDRELPQAYTPDLYHEKCEQVYQHVYDSYFGAGKSIFSAA
ncbi:MAG TPA: HsdR family type I site-specific deoxyribonuclease, partial [Chloroflexia bacterium]